MYIEFYDADDQKLIGTVNCESVPRVGEFVSWKKDKTPRLYKILEVTWEFPGRLPGLTPSNAPGILPGGSVKIILQLED